ncbi:hypothetical protein R1flu_000635 [Riccia fluitans]|uniref:Uncharacterized protein n=1 Tax=Riccia fluitans TaxID=41844 RepID=A0ABD1Y0Z9_9MARC
MRTVCMEKSKRICGRTERLISSCRVYRFRKRQTRSSHKACAFRIFPYEESPVKTALTVPDPFYMNQTARSRLSDANVLHAGTGYNSHRNIRITLDSKLTFPTSATFSYYGRATPGFPVVYLNMYRHHWPGIRFPPKCGSSPVLKSGYSHKEIPGSGTSLIALRDQHDTSTNGSEMQGR